MSELEALRARIAAADAAWVTGDVAPIAALFHPDVVLLGPDGSELVRGRDALVQSYREFLSRVALRAYETGRPWVHIAGDTAVCRYRFTIAWADRGMELAEEGSELLVFTRTPEGWQAVLRQRGT